MAGDKIDWEVRTTGNDSNGGGFVDGASGTDYSQQASAQVTLTTASVVGTDTTHIDVDAGDHTVAAADVGNIVNITGGTASNQGRFVIEGVDVGNNRWHLSGSLGTAAQTVSGSMGGCLASIGEMTGEVANYTNIPRYRVAGGYFFYHIHVASGTYTITTTTAGSAGPLQQTLAQGRAITIEGYNSTRGDQPLVGSGNQPVITVDTTTGTNDNFIDLKCSLARPVLIRFIKFDGNSKTVGWSGPFVGGYQGSGVIEHCEAVDFDEAGFGGSSQTANAMVCKHCVASGCGDYGFHGQKGTYLYCKAVDNTGDGFYMQSSEQTIAFCVSANNGGKGIRSVFGSVVRHCTIVNNTSDGIYQDYYDCLEVESCIVSRNGGYGLRLGTDPYNAERIFVRNCYHYSNTSGGVNESNLIESGEYTAAGADPVPNYATDDWSPSSAMKITDSTYKSEFEEGDIYVGAVQLAATGTTRTGMMLCPFEDAIFDADEPTVTNIANTTNKYASKIRCQKAGTLDRFLLYKGPTLIGSPTYTVRLETVAADGTPSGTLAGTTTSASWSPVGTNAWDEVTLTSSHVAAAGDEYFIVVQGSTADVSNYLAFGWRSEVTPNGKEWPPCYLDSGGGYTLQDKTSGAPACLYSDDVPTQLPILGRIDRNTALTFDSADTPDELALKFVSPFTGKIAGMKVADFEINAGATFDMVLYNSAGQALATKSLDDAVWGGNNAANKGCIFFDSEISVVCGSVYRLAVKATHASNTLTLARIDYYDAHCCALEHGMQSGDIAYSTRTDGGTWTDDTAKAPLWKPIYSEVDTQDAQVVIANATQVIAL